MKTISIYMFVENFPEKELFKQKLKCIQISLFSSGQIKDLGLYPKRNVKLAKICE